MCAGYKNLCTTRPVTLSLHGQLGSSTARRCRNLGRLPSSIRAAVGQVRGQTLSIARGGSAVVDTGAGRSYCGPIRSGTLERRDKIGGTYSILAIAGLISARRVLWTASGDIGSLGGLGLRYCDRHGYRFRVGTSLG